MSIQEKYTQQKIHHCERKIHAAKKKQKKNDIEMGQLSHEQIGIQIIGEKFDLKQSISHLKKKTGSSQIRT